MQHVRDGHPDLDDLCGHEEDHWHEGCTRFFTQGYQQNGKQVTFVPTFAE